MLRQLLEERNLIQRHLQKYLQRVLIILNLLSYQLIEVGIKN